MKTLGQKLKSLREEKGLLQKEVCSVMNCSITMLSTYERDKRDPDTETLKKLADFYSVSTDYLLGRTDVKHIPNTNNSSPKSNFGDIELTEKDKKEIDNMTTATLEQAKFKLYEGKMSTDPETLGKFEDSLRELFTNIKVTNKKKYTPKKYKK